MQKCTSHAPVMTPSCSLGQKRFMFFCSSSCPDVHSFFLAPFLLSVLHHFLRLSCSNFVYLSFSTPSFSLALFLLSVLLISSIFLALYLWSLFLHYISLSLALYLQFVLLHFFFLSFFYLTQPVDPSHFLILASFVQIFFFFSKFLSVSFTFNLFQSFLISFSLSHLISVFLSHSKAIFSSFIYLSVSSNFMSINLQLLTISHNLCLQNYFLSLALGCELIASFTIVSESSQINCLVLHVE
jgi:hypothetical protein